MQPTKEEWKRLEDGLRGVFGRAELRVDGHRLTLEKRQISESKLVIVPFVDGWHRGEWLTKDCEARRRFMSPRTAFVYTQKERRRWKRFGRRTLEDLGIDPDAKFTYYCGCWTSFTPLRRHLAANNEHIEILTISGEWLSAKADS